MKTLIDMAREAGLYGAMTERISWESFIEAFAALLREDDAKRIAILEQDNANCRKAVSDLMDKLAKREAFPNLDPVINWLENGCDPKEAAKELRIYESQRQTHSEQEINKVQEPFGYFRAMPFGWEDCGENDEGAVALYDRPQVVSQQKPSDYDREFWGDGQQEPVAWVSYGGILTDEKWQADEWVNYGGTATPLYTTPPTAPNLNCKSVQRRLATSWGYVLPEQQEQQEPVAYMHTLEGDVQINNLPAECYGDHWKREPLFKYPPTAALPVPDHFPDATKKVEQPKMRRAGSFGE